MEQIVFIGGIYGFFFLCISINANTLRLSCKYQAKHYNKREHVALQGYVFETLLFKNENECQLECLMNYKCGSMNIEKTGDQRCELNNKTALEVEELYSWKSRPGWKYISSSYSQTAVGQICQNQKPCGVGAVCKDICSCPGYQCYPSQEPSKDTTISGVPHTRKAPKRSRTPQTRTFHVIKTTDCQTIYERHSNKSGFYSIKPLPALTLQVYCTMIPQEGWILVQRRNKAIEPTVVRHVVKGNFRFQVNFISFYWLGLENLHVLTNTGKPAMLRIFLEDERKKEYWAQYDFFKVGDKARDYSLMVGGYSGNAGDVLRHHNGLPFITFHRDSAICFGWWASPMASAPDCIFNNLNLQYQPFWGELSIISASMTIKFSET